MALIWMTSHYRNGDASWIQSYLLELRNINNWDLVDGSAPMLGDWCMKQGDFSLLHNMALSASLWDKRIAMVATLATSRAKNPEPALLIAQALVDDRADLIQKAVGWMLREMDKRCGGTHLRDFLEKLGSRMGRTALRYATEHLSEKERLGWLQRTRIKPVSGVV